ncbi:hypothetical protein [Sporofaciens sp. JLR.KK001]|jgi:hypothetical protein|uniref:hypothetical protein n=1 Tax=Sporofaciens sp. JLR.KK001 TaxID=3112621 RepID=UPI002FF2CDEA
MENILNIVYREPELEDAEKIVDFYNYVGGETTFLKKISGKRNRNRDDPPVD